MSDPITTDDLLGFNLMHEVTDISHIEIKLKV